MSVVITSGDPAGIGIDIILKLASHRPLTAVVLGDIDVFKARAALLNLPLQIEAFEGQQLPLTPGTVVVQHLAVSQPVTVGTPSPENAEYILSLLDAAVAGCVTQNYSAMVTAPVCKATICQAGHAFNGHTDYIAKLTQTSHVVMMLACHKMRVALVTTHLPLKEVPTAITPLKIEQTILTVRAALQQQFGIETPKVMVAGLNPHAGENGYLGREEIEIIQPTLAQFNANEVVGPVAADTMFSPKNCQNIDAFIAMYHDQGLAVLKYAGFGDAVNITLGLPIIRTSVDHGTAFSLAGSGKANDGSLAYALKQAQLMSQTAVEY